MNKSSYPKGSRAPATTATSQGARTERRRRMCHPSMGSRVPTPAAAPPGTHAQPPSSTYASSTGSGAAAPTPAAPGARPARRICTCPHPTDIRRRAPAPTPAPHAPAHGDVPARLRLSRAPVRLGPSQPRDRPHELAELERHPRGLPRARHKLADSTAAIHWCPTCASTMQSAGSSRASTSAAKRSGRSSSRSCSLRGDTPRLRSGAGALAPPPPPRPRRG